MRGRAPLRKKSGSYTPRGSVFSANQNKQQRMVLWSMPAKELIMSVCRDRYTCTWKYSAEWMDCSVRRPARATRCGNRRSARPNKCTVIIPRRTDQLKGRNDARQELLRYVGGAQGDQAMPRQPACLPASVNTRQVKNLPPSRARSPIDGGLASTCRSRRLGSGGERTAPS